MGAIVGMVFGAMAGLVLICVGLSYGCKKLSARINRPKMITSPMQPGKTLVMFNSRILKCKVNIR